jgi:DNA modification methylase
MCGEKAVCCWTDPPYGIEYKAVSNKFDPIANDKGDVSTLVYDAYCSVGLSGDSTVFIACDWRSLESMRKAMRMLGLKEKACIVWDKVNPAQHLDRYFKQHEFILYAGLYGGESTIRGDVWTFKREVNPGDHPTPKPIGLISQALQDCRPNNVVDFFAGSGSTLIAAEQTGIPSYCLELSSAYCDIILARWEACTGKTAELIENATT